MIIKELKNGFSIYIDTEQMKRTGGGAMKPLLKTAVIIYLKKVVKQLEDENN